MAPGARPGPPCTLASVAGRRTTFLHVCETGMNHLDAVASNRFDRLTIRARSSFAASASPESASSKVSSSAQEMVPRMRCSRLSTTSGSGESQSSASLACCRRSGTDTSDMWAAMLGTKAEADANAR